MHNPFRNIDRYLMLGGVSARAATALRTPAILDFFTKLIMRTSPKSYPQAKGEVTIWCVVWSFQNSLVAMARVVRPVI